MAQSSSTGIKNFVKHALTSYYKNFQIKLADGPESTDVNPAIKINNGKIYVHNVGNYNGNINNSSTLLEVITSMGNNVNDINSEIIDINGRIASIPGASKMIAGNNDLTILIGEDGSTYFYVEGYRYNKDTSSFAEGNGTIADGTCSHAEGKDTKANGDDSHAEGNGTIASGFHSHTEGHCTTANGLDSHAEGNHTKTSNDAEHAEGVYNQSHKNQTIHSIGIGTDGEHRKNAFEVMQDGSIYVYGLGNYDGSTLSNALTLLDICNSKADKIINATENNFVSLDASGNLLDSGKKSSDFASVNHTHDCLMSEEQVSINASYAGHQSAAVMCDSTDEENPYVCIGLVNEASNPFIRKDIYINFDNIDNLNRALDKPQVPTENSDRLSTSGQIYEALQNYENKLPILTLTLEKDSQDKYPVTAVDLEVLQDFISSFPNNKTIPCEVYINNVRTPAIISRVDILRPRRPLHKYVHLSFRNKLYSSDLSITTDTHYWNELDESGGGIIEFIFQVTNGEYLLSSSAEQALINLRRIAVEGGSTICHVLITVDEYDEGQQLDTHIIDAKVDGFINWRETSTAGIYKYTLFLCGNIFTIQSNDAELSQNDWNKQPIL